MPPETMAPEAAPAELDELATLGFGPDEDDLQAMEDASDTRAAEVPYEEPEPLEASGVAIALFANQGKAAEYINSIGQARLDRQEMDEAQGFSTAVTVGEPIFTARGRGRVRMYLPLFIRTDRRDATGGDQLRQVAYAGIGRPEMSPLSIRVEVSR